MASRWENIRRGRLLCIVLGCLLLYAAEASGQWHVGLTWGFQVWQTVADIAVALIVYGLITLFPRKGDADYWDDSDANQESQDDGWGALREESDSQVDVSRHGLLLPTRKSRTLPSRSMRTA